MSKLGLPLEELPVYVTLRDAARCIGVDCEKTVTRYERVGGPADRWPEPTAKRGSAKAWPSYVIEPFLRKRGWRPLSELKAQSSQINKPRPE